MRLGKLLLLVSCLLLLFGIRSDTRASGRTTSFHTNGVTGSDNWVDMSNPADPIFGLVELFPTAGGYQVLYQVNDANFTFFDFGQGPIPSSAVKFSGGSVTSGKMVISVDVNTCQLDPTVFLTTNGPCGIINVTWTEVPGHSPTGFTSTIRGSRDITTGTMSQHLAGTMENAVAVAEGTVIGTPTAPTTIDVFIGVSHEVTVTTQF
jgi:hypothetical protein